jgi:hypothetical protein
MNINDLFKNYEIKRVFDLPNYNPIKEFSEYLSSDYSVDSIIVSNNTDYKYEDYNNPKIFKKIPEQVCSIFDEKINKFLWNNNNRLTKRIENILKKKGILYQDDNYYPEFDKILSKFVRYLKIIKKEEIILDYMFFCILDLHLYTEEELTDMPNEEFKKILLSEYNKKEKYHDLIFNKRIEYKYERVPLDIDFLNYEDNFYQIFAIRNHKLKTVDLYLTNTFSDNRFQADYAKLFLTLKQKGKKISSHIISINKSYYQSIHKENELYLINKIPELDQRDYNLIYSTSIKKGRFPSPML